MSHDWNRASSLYEVRVMGLWVMSTAPKLSFDLYLMCASAPTGMVSLVSSQCNEFGNTSGYF